MPAPNSVVTRAPAASPDITAFSISSPFAKAAAKPPVLPLDRVRTPIFSGGGRKNSCE